MSLFPCFQAGPEREFMLGMDPDTGSRGELSQCPLVKPGGLQNKNKTDMKMGRGSLGMRGWLAGVGGNKKR